MMMTVALIALALVIGLFLGYRIKTTPIAPIVTRTLAAFSKDDLPVPADGAQLLLCHRNDVRHEIAWHQSRLPLHVEYAGKRYTRYRQRKDGAWEYRR